MYKVLVVYKDMTYSSAVFNDEGNAKRTFDTWTKDPNAMYVARVHDGDWHDEHYSGRQSWVHVGDGPHDPTDGFKIEDGYPGTVINLNTTDKETVPGSL